MKTKDEVFKTATLIPKISCFNATFACSDLYAVWRKYRRNLKTNIISQNIMRKNSQFLSVKN